MTNNTITVTMPSDTSVQVERTFDAPAQLVWDAHTKPELIRQWLLGPDGWDMPICDVDLRPGGDFHYRWAHPTEGAFSSKGTFSTVTPVSYLAFTERMEGFEGESQNSYTLVERDGRTTITMSMDFGSQEARDGAVATGMADGIGVSFDRLEALLPSLS